MAASSDPIPGADDRSDRDLLRPVAALTGLEQAHFLAVAGAPSSSEMLAELTAFGLPINEFYGSSETIIVTCSPPDRIRLGTVGTPLAGARLRLGEDGEILIAGPTITPGYYRDPERTAEALEPDGWFHTGDIGALDDDGYLHIVDRKKALIINSFGKNMSPANIEQAIKGGQPMISQVLVVGDRRPYNVALIVLDRDGSGCRPGPRAGRYRVREADRAPGGPGRRGRGGGGREPAAVASRADPALPGPGPRLAARRRAADPDRQGQTRRGCRAVPGGHRRLVRMTA